MEELYKEQIKTLKKLYELMNKEVEMLNRIIDISMTDEDYKKYRKQAELLMEEEEEWKIKN